VNSGFARRDGTNDDGAAVGRDRSIATGAAAVGDEVIAFQILGGYASALNARASDVFAKPATLDFGQAANLLLAGTTAAELLAVAAVTEGDTVLLHGAAGAVDASLALLEDRRRLVTLTAIRRAAAEGFTAIGASNPASGPFRAKARAGLVEMAAAGDVTVRIARAFSFQDAREAVAALQGPHPSGKLALVLDA
jgi:NADPH:quinone reductase